MSSDRYSRNLDATSVFVVAVAVGIWKGEKLLALQRSQRKDVCPGAWEVPAGRVNVGEEPLSAAQREVQEETALEVQIDPRPLAAYTTVRGAAPMIVVVYRATYVSGILQLSAEHDDGRWCSSAEFEKLCQFDPLKGALGLSQ